MKTIIPAHHTDGVSQIALRVPSTLRTALRAEAQRQGRSLNTHIVMLLRGASEVAAGGSIGVQAPAAENDNAALQGGAI